MRAQTMNNPIARDVLRSHKHQRVRALAHIFIASARTFKKEKRDTALVFAAYDGDVGSLR